MKYLIQWKARQIDNGELVKDETIIDNQDLNEAERMFYEKFNFNKYRNVKITKIKGV